MIVGGKNKETGKFVFQVYNASNQLFATVEGDTHVETMRAAEFSQREALAPIMSAHTNHASLEMSDDDLLRELSA